MSEMNPDYIEKACRDCGVKIGDYHKEWCNQARCPYCGGPMNECLEFCMTTFEKVHLDDREVYHGLPWSVQECREYGLDFHQDFPNLNRLLGEAQWSREKRRFVMTNFTEALGDMRANGIGTDFAARGSYGQVMKNLVEMPGNYLYGPSPRAYAVIDRRGWGRLSRGKDFTLFTGPLGMVEQSRPSMSSGECQRLVATALASHGVEFKTHLWPSGDFRIQSASIRQIGAESAVSNSGGRN